MNRATLTAQYLEEVRRHGARARDLIGRQPESDLLNAFYHGRYLSRPLFLGHAERVQLENDLLNLRSALVSIPDRHYGGDVAAFARDIGLTDVQVSAIMRSRVSAVTRQARADLYVDETGFRLLEYNMGSALGGQDNADMCDALLEHPVLAEFARVHQLECVNSMQEEVNNRFAECGFAPGSRPVMATADWPSSYRTLEPYIRQYTSRLQKIGVDAYPCHIGELEVRDNRVWLGDRALDAICRLFMIEDLLEYPDAPALVEPILDAAARGWIKIFTPLDADLYASKGALAILSDEDNRSRWSPAELASLDRLLPWTRMVRPGPVTLEDGCRVDLVQYALDHREDLALKPTSLHGGQGVLLGWRSDTTAQLWEEQVRAALDGPYVVQRRIRPLPELFPADDGDLAPWIVTWGVFTGVNGFAGVFARATTVESNVEVINLDSGAYAGTCMVARPADASANRPRPPES